jgi:hypothetical protein
MKSAIPVCDYLRWFQGWGDVVDEAATAAVVNAPRAISPNWEPNHDDDGRVTNNPTTCCQFMSHGAVCACHTTVQEQDSDDAVPTAGGCATRTTPPRAAKAAAAPLVTKAIAELNKGSDSSGDEDDVEDFSSDNEDAPDERPAPQGYAIVGERTRTVSESDEEEGDVATDADKNFIVDEGDDDGDDDYTDGDEDDDEGDDDDNTDGGDDGDASE